MVGVTACGRAWGVWAGVGGVSGAECAGQAWPAAVAPALHGERILGFGGLLRADVIAWALGAPRGASTLERGGYREQLVGEIQERAGWMSRQAEEQGANAIVNVRFATSSVAQGAAELFAYGTAVTVE